MSQKSFDEFYFSTNAELKSLDQLNEYYEEKRNYRHFDGKMFCPECHKAKLKYIPKSSNKRAYLAAIDVDEHIENCSYKYDTPNSKQLKKCFAELNEEDIENKLQSMLNKLSKPIIAASSTTGSSSNNNPLIITTGTGNQKNNNVKKSIPQRNLKFKLKKEDADYIFLFYGEVYLSITEEEKQVEIEEAETIETEEKKQVRKYFIYYLEVTTKENNQKYKIYRGSKKDEVEKDKIYQIVLFGSFNEDAVNFPQKRIELIKKGASKSPNQNALIFCEK